MKWSKMKMPRMKMKDMKKATRSIRRVPGKFLALFGVALTSLFVLWRVRRHNRHEYESVM